MQFMRNIILVFGLLFSLLYDITGQFKKGYIVFENGDTLQGLIRDDSPDVNSTKVCFRKDSNDNKRIISASEIRFFKRDNESFIKITIDTINNKAVNRLLMIISDGRLKLLRSDVSSPMGGMAPLGSGFIAETDYYILTSSGIVIKLLQRNYQQILDKYFSDKKVHGKKYKFDKIEIDFNDLNK